MNKMEENVINDVAGEKEQKEVILRFIRGEDVLAVLPTGFGKSHTCHIHRPCGRANCPTNEPAKAIQRNPTLVYALFLALIFCKGQAMPD